MRTVYVLTTRLMNGSVTIGSSYACFNNMDIAWKAMNAVNEANKENGSTVYSDIKEAVLYENEEEVPILNKEKEEKC